MCLFQGLSQGVRATDALAPIGDDPHNARFVTGGGQESITAEYVVQADHNVSMQADGVKVIQGFPLKFLTEYKSEYFGYGVKDQIEFTMGEGLPLLIENVGDTVDPMLDPVLEKAIITKGKNKYIIVCTYDPL